MQVECRLEKKREEKLVSNAIFSAEKRQKGFQMQLSQLKKEKNGFQMQFSQLKKKWVSNAIFLA